jgi:hypothetical protein
VTVPSKAMALKRWLGMPRGTWSHARSGGEFLEDFGMSCGCFQEGGGGAGRRLSSLFPFLADAWRVYDRGAGGGEMTCRTYGRIGLDSGREPLTNPGACHLRRPC